MTIPRLDATRAQRINIRTLLGHLQAVLNTPAAKEYDHGDVLTCTIGYAYRSRLFKYMNEDLTVEGEGAFAYLRSTTYDDVDSVIDSVFGVDYRRRIVYGSGSSTILTAVPGIPQLKAAIKYIEKSYGIKAQKVMTVETVVNVDALQNKIEARIKQLSEFVVQAIDLGPDYAESMRPSVERAQNEIKALNKVLAL